MITCKRGGMVEVWLKYGTSSNLLASICLEGTEVAPHIGAVGLFRVAE